MNRQKMKPMIVACSIVMCILVSMSFVIIPRTVNASEPVVQPENETETVEKSEAHGTISITGSTFMECGPDRLSIYLKIVGKDMDSAVSAREKAPLILDQVLKALKNLGILEDDISTTSYELEPKYEWENSKRVFRGYFTTVTIKVTLKEKDFEKAGLVIDRSADAGAYIDSLKFELSREKREEKIMQL